jgi:hypothetical protein
MCASHNSAVGIWFRHAISWHQFIEPSTPDLVLFRQRPDFSLKNRPSVGHSDSSTIVAVGVAKNPRSIATVRSSDAPSSKYERPAGVARFFHRTDTLVSVRTEEAIHVFNKDPIGSEFSDDSGVLKPES